jgi:glycine oxidase
VSLCDPAAIGGNASGVAAGMLAPAFETALDPGSDDQLDLLRAGRDAWDTLDLAIDRTGAVWRGPDPESMAARLEALGVRWTMTADGPLTDEDWRLDPVQALGGLVGLSDRLGVRHERRAVTPGAEGLLVVATGPGGRDLAPEMALLTPIKGHILRYEGPSTAEPVLRGQGVYVCPGLAGPVVGATMEAGRADLAIDAAMVEDLRRRGEALVPDLAGRTFTAETGVRTASPDGLPMVGWSTQPDTLLAVGARRNGWLLAPLVARTIAAYLADEDPGPYAARLDPCRFDT